VKFADIFAKAAVVIDPDAVRIIHDCTEKVGPEQMTNEIQSEDMNGEMTTTTLDLSRRLPREELDKKWSNMTQALGPLSSNN
jgi:hypothetical protein